MIGIIKDDSFQSNGSIHSRIRCQFGSMLYHPIFNHHKQTQCLLAFQLCLIFSIIKGISSWYHWCLQYHPWWSQWQVLAWSSCRWVLVMDQSDLAIKLAFKNNLILKILAISANLNDILDELDTILDDSNDRYFSWTWTFLATTSII